MKFSNRGHVTARSVFSDYDRHTRSSDNSRFVYGELYGRALQRGFSFRANAVISELRARHMDEAVDPEFDYVTQPDDADSRYVYSLVFERSVLPEREMLTLEPYNVNPVVAPSVAGILFREFFFFFFIFVRLLEKNFVSSLYEIL